MSASPIFSALSLAEARTTVAGLGGDVHNKNDAGLLHAALEGIRSRKARIQELLHDIHNLRAAAIGLAMRVKQDAEVAEKEARGND